MGFAINPADKILVMVSGAGDLAAACGGFVCKYGNQIDLFCVNKDDFRQGNTEIKVKRYDEFCSVIRHLSVNKCYIRKPADVSIEQNQDSYYDISDININDYDIILIPHKDEKSPDHQFISNILLKTIINDQGCREGLKILRYEIWTPIKDADYYEDITEFIDNKGELINSYRKHDGLMFSQRVLSSNKFRTFTSYLSGSAEYTEAFFVDDLGAYLEKPDIINEITDKDFRNETVEAFLKENNAQEKINEAALRFDGKRIVIYGAGDFLRGIFRNCDLSKLQIISVSDKRFEQNRVHEFYGLRCIKPQDLPHTEADVLLIADMDFVKTYDFLTNTILKDSDIEIAPLIKTDLPGYIKGNTGNKVCARPFHVLSIVSTGHCITCCPAYINNFTIGNVFRDTIENVWQSRRANDLRNSLINNDYTICDLNTCIYTELIDKKELSKYYEEDNKTIKMPDTIFMSWDYDCNVACITCRNQLIKNDENTIKSLEAIEGSVLEACKNAKLFYASGNGDPFGSSYARNIIKKVVEINPQIKFIIHTNGILCNEKMCNELNITDKIKAVTFSIHAACKETYDKIVRYGNFERVLHNLEWLSKLKKEGKIDDLTLVFVVHKLNYRDMPDFVRMAEKYNAVASFRYYRQWANNTEYRYEDMAVFNPEHPEYSEFAGMLRDEIFDSPHCILDPNLKFIHKGC